MSFLTRRTSFPGVRRSSHAAHLRTPTSAALWSLVRQLTVGGGMAMLLTTAPRALAAAPVIQASVDTGGKDAPAPNTPHPTSPALTELPAAQCQPILGTADFHCYATPTGWVLAKTRQHAELAATDVAKLNADFARYFAKPAPRFAVVTDTNLVTTAEVMRLRALGAQGSIPWPIDSVFEQLGVMNHELGHLYFLVSFPGGHSAAWLKEVSAILMERPASIRSRYRQLAWILQSPRRDEMLIPLARLFTTPNLGHPGGNSDDATLGVQRGIEISGTLPPRDTAHEKFVPPASGVYSPGTLFYEECMSLIGFLIDQSGDSTIFRTITDQAARGTQMAQWLAQSGARYHLPSSVEALDRAWRDWMAQHVPARASASTSMPVSTPARLAVRPSMIALDTTIATRSHAASPSSGTQPLYPFVPLNENAFVYVPPQCVGRRAPLVVLLHGAEMSGYSMLTVNDGVLQMAADWFGFILVAPKSTRHTWQLALGSRAKDSAETMDRHRIDDVVKEVMQHYDIDPARIALAGVSDGATTALILGYVNGDLFSRVIAWSPGLELGDLDHVSRQGTPPIFIAHGDQDEFLPIANTRAIVPWLRQAGYSVTYAEDHEHHYLTKERAVAALQWLSESWLHSSGTTTATPSSVEQLVAQASIAVHPDVSGGTETDTHVLMPVMVHGHAATVVLDLGSDVDILNPALLAQSGIPSSDGPLVLDSLTFGSATERNIDMNGGEFGVVAPLQAPVAKLKMPPLVGLLGTPVLAHYDMVFDGPARQVRIYRPSPNTQMREAPEHATAWFPPGITSGDCVPMQDVEGADRFVGFDLSVNGHSVKGFFDSGAEFNAMNLEAAQVLGLTQRTPGVHQLGVQGNSYPTAGVASQKEYELTGSDLALGSRHLPSQTIKIFTHYPARKHPIVALGVDAFRDRILFVSYSSRQVCLGEKQRSV